MEKDLRTETETVYGVQCNKQASRVFFLFVLFLFFFLFVFYFFFSPIHPIFQAVAEVAVTTAYAPTITTVKATVR